MVGIFSEMALLEGFVGVSANLDLLGGLRILPST